MKDIKYNLHNHDLVIYGFSILHRIDFLDYTLHFGTEHDSLDALLQHIAQYKPSTFATDIRPHYDEFKKYVKEFYAILIDNNQTDNIIYCGLNHNHVFQRVSALIMCKRKYNYYHKRPEKFMIKHESYTRIKCQK